MLSDYWMEKLCKLLSHKTNITAPDTYVALFTTIPTRAGTGGTEVTGAGYARQIINPNGGASPAWAAPASQTTKEWRFSNANSVSWTASGADYGDVVGFGIYDSLTSGGSNNLLLADFFTGEWMAGIVTDSASTDTIKSDAHGLSNGNRVCVRMIPGTTIPTGLSETTLYYVVNANTDDFQVSLTAGGAAVALTGDGEIMFAKVTPRTVNDGETISISANALQLFQA